MTDCVFHAYVLNCKTVEHRSGKSRDLLQTKEFTISFQCSCMRTVAHLFLRVSSISAHGSGRILFLDVVSENIPSWHGLCLSRMVIAFAAMLLC